MFLAYYDESGDDGFPAYSSPLFALSACYMHYQNWRDNFELVRQLRQHLSAKYKFPVKFELHTKEFLLNKNPYGALRLSDSSRVEIVDLFCDTIANLNLKIVNVVINKKKIVSPKYDVLDTSLTYSVQRIANDLERSDPANKFLIITDEGRIGKMRKTTRKVQKINFIPSKYSGGAYRKEIKSLIEDPLPKESRESYFVQLADLCAFVTYSHKLLEWRIAGVPKRMPTLVNANKIEDWLDRISPSINLEAAASDKYGIVYHPK